MQRTSDLLKQLVASLLASSTLLEDDNNRGQSVQTHLITSRCHIFIIITGLQASCSQICAQAVNKLRSHCLFLDVVTSLEQAVNNL
jgi:hypothetical protein